MIQFGTKAETLYNLKGHIKNGNVLPQIMFTVREWENNSESLWSQVKHRFGEYQSLAIRSSAINEDTSLYSNAGKYLSVLDVTGKKDFFMAVKSVITSFGSRNELDQVLIQPMLKDISICGVAFTLEPNTSGNYYVINYDDVTGSTESITSGNIKNSKLYYCFKNHREVQNKSMRQVCICLAELEDLFGLNKLDVEFAINTKNELFILQVRLLCIDNLSVSFDTQKKVLDGIYQKVINENGEKPFLYGSRTIYGVMPDWNPAEIIGVRPNPLALSLYKEIITDNIWAYQRDNYGYKNLRSFPLLIDFSGLPYIDVRVSFNSFLPASLRKDLCDKLVNYYLDKLQCRPDLHDKIEFEIAFTCYTLDLPERIKCLNEFGFTKFEITEIIDALRDMTKKIIDNEEGLWKKDFRKIKYLEKRYQIIMESNLDSISKIYWLLEDCKRYGTLPFAGLARAGFIAVELLKSMVNKDIISLEEYQLFMGDLNTISSTMKKDMEELSKAAFLKKYGHLRPGTYDISSKRYDEAPDLYFDWKSESQNRTLNESDIGFKLSLNQMNKLKKMLGEHGLPDDVLGIFHFIKTAIEGREYAKFIFTKNLSDAIRLFEDIGKQAGYTADECAFTDISIIKILYASSLHKENLLKESIRMGKEKYDIAKSITLPPLICYGSDVFSFFYPDIEPNYITLKEATGNIYYLEGKNQIFDIDNKIVMIPSADPGYDWIFSHSIKGFITKWGGANSHMAIRANELQIPAVIGVGEKLFETLRHAKIISIDTLGKRVNILK